MLGGWGYPAQRNQTQPLTARKDGHSSSEQYMNHNDFAKAVGGSKHVPGVR